MEFARTAPAPVIDPADPLPLNESQRRHFEVVLASLEESLARITETMARAGDAERALSGTEDDLPARFVETAPAAIARAREQLRALAAAMRIEPRTHSAARSVRAILTSHIVELEDSDAKRLRAYGAVDPSLAPRLEPALAELRATLQGLRAALRDRAPGA